MQVNLTTLIQDCTDDALLSHVVHHFLHDGRAQEARALLASWQQRSPNSAWASAMAALCTVRLGQGSWQNDADAAGPRQQAEAALAFDPRCAPAHLVLAHIALQSQRFEDALASAERAANLMPHDPATAVLLALIHLELRQIEQAESVLRRQRQPSGMPQIAGLALSELLINHGGPEQYVEAARLAQEVCASEPHRANAWALWGCAHARLAQWEPARRYLERALLLEPDHNAVLLQLIQVLLQDTRSGQVEQAITHAKRLATLSPQTWKAWDCWAQGLNRQGQFETALRVLGDAVERHPDQPNLWLSLARVSTWLDQPLKAQNALDKAAALKTTQDADLLIAQTDLLLRQELPDQAWQALELAEGILPQDPIDQPKRLRVPLHDAVRPGQVLCLYATDLAQSLLLLRYVPLLESFGIQVKLGLPHEFAALLQGMPAVVAVDQVQQLRGHWFEPLWRLPGLLGVTADAAPSTPYLEVPQYAVERVTAHSLDSHRKASSSCVLLDLGLDPDPVLCHALGPWLEQQQAWVVCAQERPVSWANLTLNWTMVAADDVVNLAAWALRADHVICCDVPLAHVVAALDVSVQVLLSPIHDGIWGGTPDRTSWYPSARLWRLSVYKSWGALLQALAGTLCKADTAQGANQPGAETQTAAKPNSVEAHT